MENANIFYYLSGVSQLTDSFSLTHTADHLHAHWQEDVKKKKRHKNKRTAEPASISTKLSVTLQASYFHTGLSSKCTRGPIEYHITKNWITKSVSKENPNNPTALARPNLSRIKQGYPPLALYQLLLSFNMSLFLKDISPFLLFFFFPIFYFSRTA